MNQSEKDAEASHWAILSALRFFLAVAVVLGHFSLFVRFDQHRVFGDGYLNPGSAVFGFFILSGYSIAASLARETTGFYQRRFVRIWPLYLATIAFGLLVSLLVPHGFTWPLGGEVPAATPLSIFASIFMLQTVISYPMPIVGPIWSLSTEWWHYMLSPLYKKISNGVLYALIGLSFVAFLTILPARGHGIDFMQHGLVFLTSSWLWLTGFLYYRIKGTSVGFTLLLVPSLFVYTLGHFIGVPVFIAIFVLIGSHSIQFKKGTRTVFNFLGDLSFPLYLFHIPAIIAALTLGSNRSAITLSAALVVSLAALYLVDYPSREFFKRNRKKAALSAVSQR